MSYTQLSILMGIYDEDCTLIKEYSKLLVGLLAHMSNSAY